MTDMTRYIEDFAEMMRQTRIARDKPAHGLVLNLPTAGSVRVHEGDETLLLFAGTQRGDDSFPAMLDVERAAALRDYLVGWLAAHDDSTMREAS